MMMTPRATHLFWLNLVFWLANSSAYAEPLPPAASAVATEVEALAADLKRDGLTVGIAVRTLSDGALLAAHGATELLSPASGAKLLSTAVVLHALSLDHRFTTALHGQRDGERVRNLTLVAGGDPALKVADLKRLAARLAELGVREVEGGLALDTGHFAGSATPPAFDLKNTDAAYRPEVPAFAVDFGAVVVNIRPGRKIGDPVRVTTHPAVDAIVVANSAQTVAGKRSEDVVISVVGAEGGPNRVIVNGKMGAQAKAFSVRRRLADPQIVAAELLVSTLRSQKIRIQNRITQATQVPPRLAAIEGRPVADLVRETNTMSNNFMAEALFKQLGGDKATWDKAQRAVTTGLKQLGVDPRGFKIVNGSGLYRGTLVSAAAMTQLLVIEGGDSPHAKAFQDSLAVAGVSGTLRRRLTTLKGQVRAKTGTLDDALSLSGYAPSPQGAVAFSVIVNGAIGGKAAQVLRRIDAFLLKMAGN